MTRGAPARRKSHASSLQNGTDLMSLVRCVPMMALAAFALGAGAPVARAAPGASSLDREVSRLFGERGASGSIVVQDVRSGKLLASASIGDGASSLPLSTVKLMVAAIYWEHKAQLPESIAPDMYALIAQGKDDPGRVLALELRRALGSKAMLDDLRRFGFPRCSAATRQNCTTLSQLTPDSEWADALSLGETHFRVTPPGLSHFLRDVALAETRRLPVVSREGAQALHRSVIEAVESGTASGASRRLGDLGMLGGKTGTGPAGVEPYDGIFAGLIYDRSDIPRYTVVTYVRRGGYGGGAAAEISADVAAFLLKATRQ
jgi:hypothetical protein